MNPLFAVFGLWLGPALSPLLRKLPPLRAVLDGLILVGIGALVLLQILPEALEQTGPWALVAAGLGLALPRVAEGALHVSHQRVHRLLVLAAVLGLFVHAASDGAAIGLSQRKELGAAHPTHENSAGHTQHLAADAAGHEPHDAPSIHASETFTTRRAEEPTHGERTLSHPHSHHHHGSGLALVLAVILHQVPVGLLLWVSVGARFGAYAGVGALLLMSSATLLGYFGVIAPLEALGPFGAGLLLAFVGGSLLHVVIGHEHEEHDLHPVEGEHGAEPQPHDTPDASGQAPVWSGLGALLALLMIALTLWVDPAAASTPTTHTFATLYLESAPALVLGFILAGLAHTYLPYASLGWLSRGRPLAQAARGVFVGLPLPICSCGVLPLFHSLVRRGVPPAAAIAFLIATPELGLDALLISIPLLGLEITLTRLLVALIVALLAGVVVARWVPKPNEPANDSDVAGAPIGDPPPHRHRLRQALNDGLGRNFDELMPWVLVGLVMAALAAPVLDPRWFEQLPTGLDVPLWALLGLPVYVCATGATPLVAVLLAKGVSPGAGIAFLLTGPATNVTTFGVVSRLWGRTSALALAACTIGSTIALGWAANVWLSGAAGNATEITAHAHTHSPLELAAGAFLALLLCVRLLVRGPRALLREVSLRPKDEQEPCCEGCDAPDEAPPTTKSDADESSCCAPASSRAVGDASEPGCGGCRH